MCYASILDTILGITWEKWAPIIQNIGNNLGNVPILFTTMGITWENVPILCTILGITWGNVSILFTILLITWVDVPIVVTILGITWEKCFPIIHNIGSNLGSHINHNSGNNLGKGFHGIHNLIYFNFKNL